MAGNGESSDERAIRALRKAAKRDPELRKQGREAQRRGGIDPKAKKRDKVYKPSRRK